MAAKFIPQRLNRIAEANSDIIKNWKEGVSLENDYDVSIDELIRQMAVARWKLGYDHRYHGNKLINSNPSHYRSAISRFYYAMYHTIRSCVYIYYKGDDFQEHSKLPTKIPPDFPSQNDWQIKLKNARLIRNRADYEPYPRSDQVWKDLAIDLKADADQVIIESRNYLRAKGCTL